MGRSRKATNSGGLERDLWHISSSEDGDGGFWRQDCDRLSTIEVTPRAIAFWVIGVQSILPDEVGLAIDQHEAPAWYITQHCHVAYLAAVSVYSRRVHRSIHVFGAGAGPVGLGPSENVGSVCGPAAIAARPVTSGEGGRLIKKEEFGPVAPCHHLPLAPLPVERTADPGMMGPPRGTKGLVIAVDDAPVACERAPGGSGNDLTGGQDAVLQGHGARLTSEASLEKWMDVLHPDPQGILIKKHGVRPSSLSLPKASHLDNPALPGRCPTANA